MRATAILSVLLLAACGAVRDRADCAASTDCPAGEYCARTPEGGVCWPDATPPSVAAVEVECITSTTAGACRRDGVLRVRATLADDAELAGAEVTLDLDGGARPVPMSRTGARWEAEVPLRRYPFDHFSHGVLATVVARDGARNEAAMDASVATTVTRARFDRRLDEGVFSLGHPAVMVDGTVVTAGTNGKVYFVAWDGTGVSSTVAVGSGQITAAPLAAGSSVWIGSEDNKVYEVTYDGSAWQSGSRTDDTGGPIRGALAQTRDLRIIAASESGFVYSATSAGYKNSTPILPFSNSAIVDGDSLLVASGNVVRRLFIVQGAPTLDAAFLTVLAGAVTMPLAAANAVFAPTSTGGHGVLSRVSLTTGDPDQLATTAIPCSGVAILADGSIVVPEQTKTLSRWTSSGAAFPGWLNPDLGGAPRTPLVLTGAQPLVVSTAKGAVHALKPDGSIAWTGQLSAGTASLQPGNIYTPPGQPAGETLSTAYFAGADGVLHAVIVDGALDAAAPWPKAFHDPRNTNRAGPQP